MSQRTFPAVLAAITLFTLGFGAGSIADAADARGGSTQASMKTAQPLPPAFLRLVKEKRALEERIAKKRGLQVPSQVGEFFTAAGKGDWGATSNLFYTLRAGWRPVSGEPWFPKPLWNAVLETFGVCGKIEKWSPEFLQLFSAEIVKSIPSGSIYFGGNDAGLFGAILQSRSHSEGRPFFTLSQSALTDEAYLGYLRDMYGEKIYIPATNEAAQCIAQYTEDAGRRLKHDQELPGEPKQVKPGEDLRWVDGKVWIEGHVSVMGMNALVAKMIFDKNPAREFYYAESFPLDWLYPHLTPHQFVFKVQRKPLVELPRASVRADREFWTRHAGEWLGPWLNPNTPLSTVTNFVVRTFLEKDLEYFKGDRHFIQDREARKAFSKHRGAVGGLYAWRAGMARTTEERERMIAEADFAFRQAFAFLPESPEAVFRYVNLLVSAGRIEDALRVAGAARLVDPENGTFDNLIVELRRMEGTNGR